MASRTGWERWPLPIIPLRPSAISRGAYLSIRPHVVDDLAPHVDREGLTGVQRLDQPLVGGVPPRQQHAEEPDAVPGLQSRHIIVRERRAQVDQLPDPLVT